MRGGSTDSSSVVDRTGSAADVLEPVHDRVRGPGFRDALEIAGDASALR
jgi:hypothetical protein